MRKVLLAVMALAILLAMTSLVMAQDAPAPAPAVVVVPAQPSVAGLLGLKIETITLMPISKGAESQAGLVASVHAIRAITTTLFPEKANNKALKLLGDYVLTDLVATGQTVDEFLKFQNVSLGTSIVFTTDEAKIQPGIVYKYDEDKWYWHLRISF